MHNLLKIIKYEKLKSNLSDDNVELLFKYIDLNIVQHWVNYNYIFSFKDYPVIRDFFTVEKNKRITACTSLDNPNWTLFSPIDRNIVIDQLKYLQLLKLVPFL